MDFIRTLAMALIAAMLPACLSAQITERTRPAE